MQVYPFLLCSRDEPFLVLSPLLSRITLLSRNLAIDTANTSATGIAGTTPSPITPA